MKAVRAIWSNKKAYLACIVLISVGIMVYVGMGSLARALGGAATDYYREYRLADVFSRVKSMPQSAVNDLSRIEGVLDVLARYVYDARVLMPGTDNIITLRLVSADRRKTERKLNDYLLNGPGFGSGGDIIISNSFAQTYGLKVGDTVTLIIEGRIQTLTISGTAYSPEFVYIVKDSKDLFSDASAFSFAYMPTEDLYGYVNKYGMANDISFQLEKGYSFENVRAPIEDTLRPYGLIQLIPRKDQTSYSLLKAEIDSNTTMSQTVPMVFLMMAVVVLYLMLKRVIEQERTQLGTLKAFGFSDGQLVMHYLSYGAATGVAGGLLGIALGVAMIGPFVDIYKEFFSLPHISKALPLELALSGFGISVGSGLAGAFFGARAILKLSPAEAMRPAAPKPIKHDILKSLPLLYACLSSTGNMAVRSILRNKVRSLLIVVGIMFSFGMLSFMGSFSTMIDALMLNQFTKVQTFDGKVSFVTPQQDVTAVESVFKIKGVTYAEPLLETAVQIKHRHRKTGVVVSGIKQESRVYKIYDNAKAINLPPPTSGVIINNGLADRLEAKKGDVLYLESPLLDEEVAVIVTDIVEQNLGTSCYMDFDTLAAMFRMPDTATSVMFKTNDIKYIKDFLLEADNVSSVDDIQSTLAGFEKMLGSYSVTIYSLNIVAIIIAFSIIYNTASISLSERKREYATLMVIGMHIKEIAGIMSFEFWTLCIGGMALGVPFTMLLMRTLAGAMASEMYTMPMQIPAYAYINGVIGCAAAVFFSNMSSVRNIKKFDMVEVLKERE